MRSVAEIQAEIEKLSRAEQRKLALWFAQVQADAWDAQIEEDVNAGRLDHLLAQAEADIAAGRTKPLDEVLDNGWILGVLFSASSPHQATCAQDLSNLGPGSKSQFASFQENRPSVVGSNWTALSGIGLDERRYRWVVLDRPARRIR